MVIEDMVCKGAELRKKLKVKAVVSFCIILKRS